jgi:hypothetical protein
MKWEECDIVVAFLGVKATGREGAKQPHSGCFLIKSHCVQATGVFMEVISSS